MKTLQMKVGISEDQDQIDSERNVGDGTHYHVVEASHRRLETVHIICEGHNEENNIEFSDDGDCCQSWKSENKIPPSFKGSIPQRTEPEHQSIKILHENPGITEKILTEIKQKNTGGNNFVPWNSEIPISLI